MTLRVVQSHSLKEKRAVLRRLRDRVAEVGVTLREVGGADTWQRADLGFAVVGQDRDDATAAVRRVVGLCAQAESRSDCDHVPSTPHQGGESGGASRRSNCRNLPSSCASFSSSRCRVRAGICPPTSGRSS